MKAWLLTWEWGSKSSAIADKIIGILNPKWSNEKVKMIVEFAYTQSRYNLMEISNCAKHSSNNPYRPNVDMYGRIVCGQHPSLHARIVENLIIITDPNTKIETIKWTELPLYEPNQKTGELTMIRTKLEKEYIRKIVGPISNRMIWDRKKGDYSDWWKSKM